MAPTHYIIPYNHSMAARSHATGAACHGHGHGHDMDQEGAPNLSRSMAAKSHHTAHGRQAPRARGKGSEHLLVAHPNLVVSGKSHCDIHSP